MDNKHKIIVVAGPTASGKSDFAVDLALKGNGEVVSADSRQVYKGLDIGTGKITREEMKGVPHHMLGVIEINDDFSVAEYARLARPIIEDILSRGKTPIICGGTGQYIDALIYDTQLPQVPPQNNLREELENKTIDELYAELLQKDPTRARAIDPHNKVRLVRALEVASVLGSVPLLEEPKLVYDTEFYLLAPARELLRDRVTKRLEKRLAIGMIEEVQSVMKQGYTPEQMKRFGLEYHIIGKYLEGGISKEEMKTEIINKSMRYAKRQDTWNKKYLAQAEVRVIEVGD